jgi:hypothetical protein
METATVTFKSDDKEIVLKFDYNRADEELNYDFVKVPQLDPEADPDLVTILTTYFLNSLVQNPAQ